MQRCLYQQKLPKITNSVITHKLPVSANPFIFKCILNVLPLKVWYKPDVGQMSELCFHMLPTFSFLVPSHFWYHNSTI